MFDFFNQYPVLAPAILTGTMFGLLALIVFISNLFDKLDKNRKKTPHK